MRCAGSWSRASPIRSSRSTSISRARSRNDNPVYYVQYAHARVCSLLRQVGERVSLDRDNGLARLERLDNEHETALMVELARYAEVVETAAATSSRT